MVRARNNNPLERPISFSKQSCSVIMVYGIGSIYNASICTKNNIWTTTCVVYHVCTISIVALIKKLWTTRNVFKVV
jgi:hypothetical protein